MGYAYSVARATIYCFLFVVRWKYRGEKKNQFHPNEIISYLKIMYFYSAEHFWRLFEYFQFNYVTQLLKTISSAPFNIKMQFLRRHMKNLFTCWNLRSAFAKYWGKNYEKTFDTFRILLSKPSLLRGLIDFQNRNSGLS